MHRAALAGGANISIARDSRMSRRQPLLGLVLLALTPLASFAAGPIARFEVEGDAERFAPDRVSRDRDEGQAAIHPRGELELWGCGNCRNGRGSDVLMSQKQSGVWSNGSAAPFALRDNEGSPTFSSDGGWLYYTSDRRGGFGGLDLFRLAYASHRKQFATPENLGPSINSPGEEGAASATRDGNTLVFASKGRKGARGWDLFHSRRSKGRMTPADRLPASINTSADEFDPALIGEAGLIFARSDDADTQPASLWFAPRTAKGFGEPVRLPDAINAPGLSVRAAAQDLAAPDHLVFTRSSTDPANGASDIYRVRFRIVTE
jgi:hypothetical protein